MLKKMLKSAIKIYAAILSPFMVRSCRFHPTCSAYMIHAIDEYGPIKGFVLGMKRLGRCHPFYKGEYFDPLPRSCDCEDKTAASNKTPLA